VTEDNGEITVSAEGWPPTKAFLTPGHPRGERVLILLRAAREAAAEQDWSPTGADLGIELLVRGPGRPPADAANYLGGIGDTLQDKLSRPWVEAGELGGELAEVALFHDDRQLREVHYREEEAETPSYRLRLYLLVPAEEPRPVPAAEAGYLAKLSTLGPWLRELPSEPREVSFAFAELEQVAGVPLPASARVHRSHWTAGSPLSRIIADAGWSATRVDLTAETLTLIRR
jgi:hypothetical protein